MRNGERESHFGSSLVLARNPIYDLFADGEFVLVCWFCVLCLCRLRLSFFCAVVVVLHWLFLWKERVVMVTKRRDEVRGSRGRSVQRESWQMIKLRLVAGKEWICFAPRVMCRPVGVAGREKKRRPGSSSSSSHLAESVPERPPACASGN